MKENIFPKILTKKAFFQIEECNCGKNPFRYHNITKNSYFVKCPLSNEELDIKTKKWVTSKKQPCDFFCVYHGERPVFNEIKNTLIKKAQKNKDKDTILEEKLRLLFQFVFVSNHSSTLDEINILVKNNLRKEPRKAFYFPSPGHLRISHYETLEDYRDRIFSTKIIDVSHIVEPPTKHELPKCNIDIHKMFNIKNNDTPIVKKQIVKKQVVSNFIVVSEDENSDSENSEQSESEQYSETDEIEELEELEEPEESEEIENPEDIYEEENFDDYGDDGYD